MISLPPLYAITDARLPISLSEQVRRFGEAGFPLVQFRGKPEPAGLQARELETALAEARDRGGWPWICVNDRADIALLAAARGLVPWGVHVGQGDLPPALVRRLPGLEGVHVGLSTCCPDQWTAPDAAADHAGVGPYRATATKEDHDPPVGKAGLEAGCRALRALDLAPVAIGGLGEADLEDGFRLGAESLAMVGALQREADPSRLLWEAQAVRWRVRPLDLGRGLVLVGGSGAGKTTLARALAPLAGLPALDLDEAVAALGRPIPELFATEGEAAFRALEAREALRLLETPAILAVGAGAWEGEALRQAVAAKGVAVLCLQEVPLRAWARVGGDPGRPLAGDREAFLARWRARQARWHALPMALPLGRPAEALARALLGRPA